ncbi:hypothetical protein ABW21_db0200800 [Orbilia brochopaga]|nr:hypothetical protein ABW21_db0200800 [Drechslerella brochopaga]
MSNQQAAVSSTQNLGVETIFMPVKTIIHLHEKSLKAGTGPLLTRREHKDLKRVKPTRLPTQSIEYMSFAECIPYISDDKDVFKYMHDDTSYSLATYILCQKLFVPFYEKLYFLMYDMPREVPRPDGDKYDLQAFHPLDMVKMYEELFDEGQKLDNLMDEVILHQFGLTMPFFTRDLIKALKQAGYGNPVHRVVDTKRKIVKFLEHINDVNPHWGPKFVALFRGFDTTFQELSSQKEMILYHQMTFVQHQAILIERKERIDLRRTIEYETNPNGVYKELVEDFSVRDLLPHWKEEWDIPYKLVEILKGRKRVYQRMCKDLCDRYDTLSARELQDVGALFEEVYKDVKATRYQGRGGQNSKPRNGKHTRGKEPLSKPATSGAGRRAGGMHRKDLQKENTNPAQQALTYPNVKYLAKAIRDMYLIEEEQKRAAERPPLKNDPERERAVVREEEKKRRDERARAYLLKLNFDKSKGSRPPAWGPGC